MAVVKWEVKVEGLRDEIDSPLCGGLYKKEYGSIFLLSLTDTCANMNCFIWPKKDTDWTIPWYLYNKDFKKWF